MCDIIFYQSKYCFKWLINNTWRSERVKAWTSYLKNVFLTSCIVSTFILWGVIHCSLITFPCHLRCRLSTNHCFEKSLFTCKVKKKNAGCVTTLLPSELLQVQVCFPYGIWHLPSWTVVAIGFRVKSGVDFPGGRCSTCWVMITPATLDLFLIATGKAAREIKRRRKFSLIGWRSPGKTSIFCVKSYTRKLGTQLGILYLLIGFTYNKFTATAGVVTCACITANSRDARSDIQ